MKRIQKERDRLLRKLARICGLTGAVGGLLCVLVPGTATGIQFAAAALLCVAAGALVFLHTERGGVPTAVGVVGVSALLIAVLATAPVLDPVVLTAVSATASVTAPSVAITLVVRRRGPSLVFAFAAVIIATLLVFFAVSGHPIPVVLISAIAGWAAAASLGLALNAAIARAAARIEEVGRAHQAERLASELEARQRQDARVLHDTVLATLSLLAHSGVGVGVGALRQQAGDDARLLKQLRLGASLDTASDAIFSPEADEDILGTTFESVRQRFARMGLDVNWHGAGQSLALPRETLDALLGALGECLENVRRHSGVNEADVTVTDDERTVRAMVTDAGNGFEPETVDGRRLGYAESVVGRLSTVGGRARVFSSPGSGTTVMLEVPKP
ncbi:histidine kinase [Agromyces sp. SYSU K20354]|uniref:sensor histidine kinase n=1 Tax=Agromyces cavernae TaxID=2898659 RepID=UPI001E3A8885|nr:ATP-binding protein [Agromyces cavernae]MCD2443982.1 histidine kinase [Agromyces cavernae]